MKKKILDLLRISFPLFLIGVLFLTGCDDDENGAAPVIERVRLTDPSTADLELEDAGLGSMIVIVGKNLSSTYRVFMNNYPVAINSNYATDRYLLVPVPDSVPTLAKSPNVPNELRVVTRFGEATYSFQFLPPPPIIEQISNEMAEEGETVTLYGKYFFFVDTVYFPGNVYATTGITTAPNGSSLTVTIPPGFNPTPGDLDVFVHSKSGTSIATRRTRFFDGRGIFADFDTNGALTWPNDWGWGIPNANITNSAPGGVITPIQNRFALINWTLAPSWGWANEKVINLVNWGGQQIFPTAPANIYNPALPASNFDIKFEMAVSAPTLEGVGIELWHPLASGTEVINRVRATDFIRSADGKWYTVTFALRGFGTCDALDCTPGPVTTYGDFLAANPVGEHHFRIVILNPTANPIPIVSAIDNVRIVNVVTTE